MAWRWLGLLLVGVAPWVGVALAGCSSDSSNEPAPYTPPAAPKTAEEVFERMVSAYHRAASYADHAQFVFQYDLADMHYDGTLKYVVALERPNKLRMEVGPNLIACDGEHLRATLVGYERQLLDLPAPKHLEPANLLDIEAIKELLYHTPGLPIAGLPIQLTLLWLEKPLEPLLEGAKTELLPPDSVGNYRCYRIRVERDGYASTYWVDKESYILRRIDLPPETIAPSLNAAEGEAAKNIMVTLDLVDATFDAAIDPQAFKFQLDEGVQLVKKFEPSETTPAGPVDVPAQGVAPASEPKTLQLTSLWKSAEIKQPGNIVVVAEADKPPRLLVLDDWKSVVELDPQGKLVATHALELPQGEEKNLVHTLRTAVDGQGKRYYLGFATGKQQVHLYDADFKRLMSYPDFDAPAVSDALLADLDGDGVLEIVVGYYDTVGVQAASLDGKRLWGNRSVANVFSVAVSEPNKQKQRDIYCTHERGTLAVIDSRGESLPPIAVQNLFLRTIRSAAVTQEDSAPLFGLAFVKPGLDLPLGLSLDGQVKWTEAPVPMHPATEVIAQGKLTAAPDDAWLLAGSDGSVHILGADGAPIDKFHTGSEIRGLGVFDLDGPVLLVATPAGVEAQRVASAPSKAPAVAP